KRYLPYFYILSLLLFYYIVLFSIFSFLKKIMNNIMTPNAIPAGTIHTCCQKAATSVDLMSAYIVPIYPATQNPINCPIPSVATVIKPCVALLYFTPALLSV